MTAEPGAVEIAEYIKSRWSEILIPMRISTIFIFYLQASSTLLNFFFRFSFRDT